MGNINSGRKPQSTALRMLRGDKHKERYNLKEPKPVEGDVVKPAGLSAGASAVWDEMAPICIEMRTLTASDTKAFAAYCELQSTLTLASASKDTQALLTLQAVNGDDPDAPLKVVVNAVLKLERETSQAIRPFYDMFGLHPLARNKIQVPKGDDVPVSKWAGMLK